MNNISKISRREFLKVLCYSSILSLLPIINECGVTDDKRKSSGSKSTNKTKTVSYPIEFPFHHSYLSEGGLIKVAMIKNSDKTYALNKAFEVNDFLSFLKPGDSVLIKVALNSDNPYPATTSPDVVTYIINLLKNKGAGNIYVGDKSPTWYDKDGGTIGLMQKTGIYQAAINAGAQIVVFDDADMELFESTDITSWPNGLCLPSIFNNVDHIISLPTLRTHIHAGFTMGIKNFVGAIPQYMRTDMHFNYDLLICIAEILIGIDKIRLSILDAFKGFNSGGPNIGNLITPLTIVVSNDIVAADIIGILLLQTYGVKINVINHKTIKRAIDIYSSRLPIDKIKVLSEGF